MKSQALTTGSKCKCYTKNGQKPWLLTQAQPNSNYGRHHDVMWLRSYVWYGIFVMWFVHYVMWFDNKMWFRLYVLLTSLLDKAFVPRLYSLLGTGQTGFKRGPSSCSSALSKITKWREQAIIPITCSLWRKKISWRVFWRTSSSSLLFRNLLPKELSLKMYQSSRWWACTSWWNYDRGSSSSSCPLC